MLATVASATTKWLIVTMSQKNLFQIERAQWLFYIWIMVLSETVVMPLYKMYVKVHKTGVSNWAQLFFERVRWLFYILKEWYKSFVMPLDNMYEKNRCFTVSLSKLSAVNDFSIFVVMPHVWKSNTGVSKSSAVVFWTRSIFWTRSMTFFTFE